MNYPWIGTQYWESPIFMHWPVSSDVLRPYVPAPFQLDLFHGQAWISIVPFKATKTSPRGCSDLISLGPLWQLNIRTYIRLHEEPAVYFLTVYTNSRLSILGAKTLLSLPYNHASFHSTRNKEENTIALKMLQTTKYQHTSFTTTVSPSSPPFRPGIDTLEHWLTERYHFYAINGKHIVKATISHHPWMLQEAYFDIKHQNLTDLIPKDSYPIVHIGSSQETLLYPFQIKGKYFGE